MRAPSNAWRPAAIRALHRLAVASLAGAIVGLLAGVVGDDGFTMGQVTLGGTVNLLLVGTLLGVLGGGIHLAVRDLRIGPAWFRTASVAVGVTVVIGSFLVHSDGVDFTR